MYPQLIHLYGPFAINTFGLMIAVGLAIFGILILKDPRTKTLITPEQLSNLIVMCIIAGIIGARLLYIFEYPQSIDAWWEIFAFWHGGISLLGSVIALLIVVPLYTWSKQIKLLPLLDIGATYAPLLQAIARIGCFFAGCCYGKPTDLACGVTYSIPQDQMLVGIKTHPTQLYHAAALGLIFIVMYQVSKRKKMTPGILTMIYFMLMSLERFCIDFFRADSTSTQICTFLSLSQCIALAILILSGLGIIVLYNMRKTR